MTARNKKAEEESKDPDEYTTASACEDEKTTAVVNEYITVDEFFKKIYLARNFARQIFTGTLF